MSLTVETRDAGNVVVLTFRGRIVLGEGEKEVREAVEKVLAQGHKKIVFDVGHISYLDSCGIGVLVSRKISAERAQAVIKAVVPASTTIPLPVVTFLHLAFEVFDELPKAVGSFGG